MNFFDQIRGLIRERRSLRKLVDKLAEENRQFRTDLAILLQAERERTLWEFKRRAIDAAEVYSLNAARAIEELQ